MDKILPKSTGKKNAKAKENISFSFSDGYSISKVNNTKLPEPEESANGKKIPENKDKDDRTYSIFSDLTKSLFSSVNNLISKVQVNNQDKQNFSRSSIFDSKFVSNPVNYSISNQNPLINNSVNSIQNKNLDLSNAKLNKSDTISKNLFSDKSILAPYLVGFKNYISETKESNSNDILRSKESNEKIKDLQNTEYNEKNITSKQINKTNNNKNFKENVNSVFNTKIYEKQNSISSMSPTVAYTNYPTVANKSVSELKNTNTQFSSNIEYNPSNINELNNKSKIDDITNNNEIQNRFNTSNFSDQFGINTTNISSKSNKSQVNDFVNQSNFTQTNRPNSNLNKTNYSNKKELKINNKNVDTFSSKSNLFDSVLNSTEKNSTAVNNIESSVQRKPTFTKTSNNVNYIQYPGSNIKIPSFFEGGSMAKVTATKSDVPSILNTPAGIMEVGKSQSGEPMSETVKIEPNKNNSMISYAKTFVNNAIENVDKKTSNETLQKQTKDPFTPRALSLKNSSVSNSVSESKGGRGGGGGGQVVNINTMDSFKKLSIETFMLPVWRRIFG